MSGFSAVWRRSFSLGRRRRRASRRQSCWRCRARCACACCSRRPDANSHGGICWRSSSCAAGKDSAMPTYPAWRVTREQGRLFFGAQRRPPLGTYALIPGQATEIPELGVRFTVGMPEPFREIHSAFTTFVFKSAIIHDKLSVTPRRPGDRIRLAGRGCTKRVSDLLAERGLTRARASAYRSSARRMCRRPSPASASPSNGGGAGSCTDCP